MASLTNNKIKDTYQSLVKFNDNGNITTSAKRLTDGFGNNSPFFVSTTQIGIGVTPTLGYDLHVNSNTKIGGNLEVGGNLTVSGTLTYIDVEDLATEDPLIKLARNNTDNLLDIGFYGKYVESTVTKYKGLYNDADDDKWKLFIGTSDEPTTVVDTGGTGYTVGTLVANIEGATGTFSGLLKSDTLELTSGADHLTITESSGDWTINNAQQNNGITIYDGTGGIDLIYNSNAKFSVDSAGVSVNAFNFTVDTTLIVANAADNLVGIGKNPSTYKLDVNGKIASNNHIIAGLGNGGTALTHNDGGGNANVTFNHVSETPEQDGSSGRIVVTTDSTTAKMTFELKDNVTSGVAVDTPQIMELYSNEIKLNQNATFTNNVDVDGNLQVDGTIKDSDGDAGTSGQILSSTGTGTDWIDFNADSAKRLEVDVKNVFGSAMTKGTVVHAAPTGTLSGNVIEVVKADANVAANMPAIGILNEDLNNDAEGKAVMFGTVQGIDTSGFSVGDELYVSVTAGNLVATKPTATDAQVQKIAIVIKSHASNGLIKVFGAGRANDVPNLLTRDITINGADFVFGDADQIRMGDPIGLRLQHNGSNSFIDTEIGNMYFRAEANDSDMVFQADDGSGANTTYIEINGTDQRIYVNKLMQLGDDVQLRLGINNDIRLYHNSTSGNNNIENHTGSLYITNYTDDEDIIFRSDNGSGDVIEYFRLDGGTQTIPFGRSPHIVDNLKLYFGNDTTNDASIKWDSTASELFIDGESKFLEKLTANNNFVAQGTVDLNVMPTHESEGSIQIGRYDGNTSRYHLIKNYVSSSEASNYIKFSLHNGTTTTDVLSLFGDGDIVVSGGISSSGALSTGNITISNSGIPQLTINDTGNGGGGGASGKIIYKNTAGNAIGLGYTSDVTTTSDFIISTDASSTYGGYLDLGASAIADPSDIILDPKTKLLVTKNATFNGEVTATEYNLPSSGMLDWANGDARIVEGLVNNYSLSFQTWDGSAVSTALRLDGNNTATFDGDVTVNGGDVTIAKQNDAPTITLLHDGTNPSTNDLLFKMQFQSDYNGSHQNWGKIEVDTNASAVRTNMDFYVKSTGGNEQLALRLEGQGSAVPNAIFDGTVTAANVFIADDVDVTNATPSTDQLRVSGYGIIGSRAAAVYITNAGGGVVQIGNGTSHNADPTALFGGSTITHKRDTIIEGDLTLTKGQITTNIGTTSHLYISPDSTTDTTGKTSMFLGTSTVDNYGISLRGARLGTDGTPTFELAVHNNSANGSVALEVDQFLATHIKGELFIEDVDNATAADTDKVLVMSNESGEVQYRTPTQLADDMNVPTGIGGAGLIPIYETTNTFTTNSNLYWDIANGRLGLGDFTPSYRLDLVTSSVDTQQYSMRISHTRNDPDQNSAGLFLRGSYSGTKSNATDIVQRGLHVDVDSSATGTATDEHRLYGIHSDTRNSGFADQVYGVYSLGEGNYTGAKTAAIGGVYGIATSDSSSTNGGVTSLYGIRGQAQVQDNGDVDNAYGVHGYVTIANNRLANVDATHGLYGEIQIDEASALTYGSMYGCRTVIDNNEGSVPTFGNQFLFHGDYQGTRGGAAYGVYCEGDRHYLEGLVSIGNNNISGGMPLNVYHATNSQIRFTTSGTGTASNDGFRVGYNGTYGQLFLYENADIRIATNNTPFAYFSSDQKFGIGTDTPAHDIEIESTNPTLILTQSGAVNQANSGRILFAEGPAYPDGHFEIKYDGASNRLRFNSPIDGTTNLMNIGRDGLIGIGTATPDNILHIRNGDTTYASQVGADTMLFLETTNISNALQFTSANTGQQYIMFGDNDPNAGWISYNHSDNNLNFRVNGSEKLRIDNAGNIIIAGQTVNHIKTDTSDGSDNKGMVINSSGGAGSSSRGAYISMYGNEHASLAGDMYITAGNTTNAELRLHAVHSGGTVTTYAGGSLRHTVSSTETSIANYLEVTNTIATENGMGTAGEWDAARIRVEATNTVDNTGFTGIRFATSTANNYGWSMGANRVSSGLGDFRIYEHQGASTGFHRITIQKTTGYLGVKDSTPSYHIDVNGTIRATGDVIAYSDRRVKDNIETIENGLEKVTKLRGVSYTRNDIEDDTTKIGVIAQEVLEVLPEVVKQDDRGKYSVSYGNMAGLFIEAIKDLKAEINELKEEIKELKSK
jgi:hypothetical protein